MKTANIENKYWYPMPKAFSIIGVFFIIVCIIGLILRIYVILKSGTFDIKSLLDSIVKNSK